MTPRIVQRRRLDHSDQRRGLGGRDLGEILVEKISRRLRHPVDRRALVLAHRHVVDVALEDFIFLEANFEHRRHRQLTELAAEGALVTFHEGPRELLRERAGALHEAVRAQVGNRGLDDADRIDSRMVVEKTIFAGEQSLHQVGLELAELDLDAFGWRARQQAADNLRLEHRVRLGDAERIGDQRDSRAVESNAHHLGRIFLRADVELAQVNRDRVLCPRVLTGCAGERHLRVAQLRQAIEQSAAIEVVTGANRKGRRKNRGGERGAALLDQRGDLAVELRKVKSDRKEHQQESAGGEIAYAPSTDSPLGAFLRRRFRFRFWWFLPSAAHQRH